MKRHELIPVTDLKEGQMKIFEIEDHRVLLVNVDSKLSAVSGSCPHYGAPLEQGVLSKDTLICPWHHACFNARSGKLQEPPALDNLYKYELEIENEKVFVKIPEEDVSTQLPNLHDKEATDNRNFVIIGAGAAGFAASQALRESGYGGKISMITKEQNNPYDRPSLSKTYLQDPESESYLPLRPDDFYQKYQIEMLYGNRVTNLDVQNKAITLQNDQILQYDKLLIATGGIPRQLEVPGKDLKNIFTLRSYHDSKSILQAAENVEHVTVVGSSFIGMEVAFSMLQHDKKVTVISPDEVPFAKTFGREIGEVFKKQHEQKGTKFITKTKVTGFAGNENVNTVELANGEKIATELVVVGIGVYPATDFVKGLTMLPDKSIKVNEYLQAAENIYAAGDIATYPDWRTGESTRVEHWRVALQQGRIAGRNMSGHKEKYTSTPFFWTKQADISLNYVGFARDWDELVIDGSLQEQDFLAYYIQNNQLLAVAGNKRSKEMDAINLVMQAVIFPGMNLLWSGCIVMVLGLGVVLVKRWRAKEKS